MLPVVKTVTILSGASLSGATFIGDGTLNGILMPATWTAAVLTFQGSFDGVTFADIYDDAGNEVSVTVAASNNIPVELKGSLWIKVRSGTGASAVNQGGDRVLSLLVRKNPIGTLR